MWRVLLLGLMMPMATYAIGNEQLLSPEKAFHLRATVVDHHVVLLQYQIAPGYYLYRDRFKFYAENATLGPPKLPTGIPKQDLIFGRVQVFHNVAEIALPLTAPLSRAITMKVTSQGCTEQGVCYVPFTHRLQIMPNGEVAVEPSGMLFK